MLLATALLCAAAAALSAPAAPASAGMSAARLANLDAAITESIAKKECPGAVVLVGRHGKVVYRKAYGNRAVAPAVEPMTVDTVFDMASLTKVVATATSVMTLVEDGKIRLAGPRREAHPRVRVRRRRARPGDDRGAPDAPGGAGRRRPDGSLYGIKRRDL